MKTDVVETKLTTKFGVFNIRVYKDCDLKEVIVLYTEVLDKTKPTLLRVHSECITGDMFGSLHCDCGQQFTKSLRIISEEGGVLIYLRQEGRGIGLFEKMKSYQLQSKGYDTIEANILLGHKPDQRCYDLVKPILDDLGISKVKLLTNNPSKVSEIAKLGIEVVERIPLIAKPNKHNKKYLETKKNKFQHFLSRANKIYFYQFHIASLAQLKSVIEFINNKTKDPLLKICAGLRADISTFKNKKETENINNLLKHCLIHSEFIPILHFSFSNCDDVVGAAIKIKETWPLVRRIQINDLKQLKINELRKICAMFEVDIPLSDDNFEIVHNKKFRNLVKKNNSVILIDNSKGKGIKETKESYKRKIDTLLSYSLNDIGLCGGFGPDSLDVYFELRRFYRINFSIDAETNLRTSGRYDPEKIKVYLHQLIRFDDPHEDGISQTKKFLQKNRQKGWDTVKIGNEEFVIHPKVFHAGHFPSSSWFAAELCKLLKNETSFCEVGCGSGIISCLLALSNPKIKISTTDINPYALENTKLNAQKHSITPRISAFTGDVLDSISPKKQFDSIFWALPFGFLDPGVEITLEEAQVFDPGYRAIRKLFQTAKKYLKPNGRLLIGFSADLGHPLLLEEIANEFGIELRVLKEKHMKEKAKVKFEILEGRLSRKKELAYALKKT